MGYVLTPTLLFVVILSFSAANANKEHFCGGDDWAPFTEAKCIKLFALAGTQSHKEASKICALENGARLVTVQSPAEQAALEQYLSTLKKANSTLMEDLWLGGSDELYDQYHLPQYNSSSFTWDRDSNQKKAPLTFTNWALDQPKKPWSKFENTCIKLHADCGKWSNELCARRHLVICEKAQTWPLQKLQQVLVDLVLQPVPIGFIYVQLPKEKAPEELWPGQMLWTDVSSVYDGVFFRVENEGKSAPFGEVQQEFSPLLDQIQYSYCTGDYCPTQKEKAIISRESGGWTGQIVAARLHSSRSPWALWTNEYLDFHTSVGEVRPRNMAIKVWKRTG